MKKAITRSLFLAFIMGIVFTTGEVFLRVFLSPLAQADKPMYVLNTDMSFWTLSGYSSFWMFLIAGIFSMALGAINGKNDKNPLTRMSYRAQVYLGFVFILTLELVSGLILNKGLGLAVWDYSDFALNIQGQVALAPAIMWLVLTPAIYFVDDVLRYYIWHEAHPDRFISYYTDLF